MAAPPLLMLQHRSGAGPRVVRYVGLTAVNLGNTFGALETGGVSISSRNRVVQVGGAVYAVQDDGVYKLQGDDVTWSSTVPNGGLPFSTPSTAGDAVVRSGLEVMYPNDVPSLVGVYRTAAGQLKGYSLDMSTGIWTEAATSVGLVNVPTGASGGLWNQITFEGQLHLFGSDSGTNLPRVWRFNPTSGTYFSDVITIADSIDRSIDAVVFNNRLHCVYRPVANTLRLGEWLAGTWTDLGIVIDAGPVNPATDIHRRCLFTDGTFMFAIVGSDSTWRTWQLDGSFTVLDKSTLTLPADLRSAAVGGGTFVGTPDGRFLGFADVDSVPGSFSFYFLYAANGTAGTSWTRYEWQGNAATMTTTGTVGDVAHAVASAKAPGGERIFTPSELDILITAKAPVLGGERIYFKAYGAVGPTDKTVEFYYNRQGEPAVATATLSGTAAGGVATRVGNTITNVQADGTTTYEITWNITADSISAGDRVQLVPRVST